jgi:hypothetical protein
MIQPIHTITGRNTQYVNEGEIIEAVLVTAPVVPPFKKLANPNWERLEFVSGLYREVYNSASRFVSDFSWSFPELGGG